MPNKRKTNNDFVDHGNHKTLYLLLVKILPNQVNIYNKPMIETLATCLCKQMLFCYLTNESLRHQRRQEKDNCLYTADPGAPLTYFNDGGVRQRFIFYTQKNPNFRICLPKKIPQCFCISKFYYLSSGKLKHANFNFGFGQKQNYKLRLCYC